MSGLLTHSPAEVARALLIDLGLGATPAPGAVWPVYVDSEPDRPDVPDDIITVYDAEGALDGYSAPTSERLDRDGFQVRVRAKDHAAGWAKANAIAIALDQRSPGGVAVGASAYCLGYVTRTSGVARLGKQPGTRRSLFTVNCMAVIRQTEEA